MSAVSPARSLLVTLLAFAWALAFALPARATEEEDAAAETVTVTDDEVYDDDVYGDDIYSDEDVIEETQTVTDDEVYEDEAVAEDAVEPAGGPAGGPAEVDGVPVLDDAAAEDKDVGDESTVGPGIEPELVPGAAPQIRRAQAGDVEDLYVTATKREQSVQDVPISMAALSANFLDDSGITNMGQVQDYVPNLTINPVTDTRGTVIRIRGIGSVGSNSGIDPSVGVFIDGVYQGRAGMSVGDLLDIERVEVLRGPQGTLYGKNTAAGLINVISKRPSYEPEAVLEGVFGNYGSYEARGSVNIPIVDEKLAMRLSGYYVTRDGFDKRLNVGGRNVFGEDDYGSYPGAPGGAAAWWPYPRADMYDYYSDEPYVYRDGRVNDDNRWGIKGRVLLDVMENFSLLVTGDYSFQDNECCVADIITYEGAPSLSPNLTFPNLARDVSTFPPGPGNFLRQGGTGIPNAKADAFDRVVNSNTEALNVVEIGGITLDAEYEFQDIPWIGGNELSLIAAWRTYSSDGQFDGDFTYYDAVTSWTETDLNQYSVELRLASPGGELIDYQTGFFFYHQSQDTLDRFGFASDFVLLFNASPVNTENIGDNTHETTSYAGFGEVTINPTEQLSITGGVRVTNETKTRVGSQFSNGPGCGPGDVPPPACLDAPPVSGPPVSKDEERVVTNVSYKGVIQYFPWEDIMLYGSYATGFKSGGFNQLRTKIGVTSEFDDELSKNVEAGFKTSFFERMLTFNVTGFHTWYEDFQAQIFDGSSINVVNAADLRSYGIEAELTVVPLPNLVIGSAFGWNIAEYDSFPNGVQTNLNKWNNTKLKAVPDGPGNPILCGGELLIDPDALVNAEEACVQDLSGKTLDNAPQYTLSVFAQYDYLLPWFPIELFVRGEYTYTSSRFLDVDLDPNLLQPDTHIGNLRAGFRAEDKMWEVTGWIRNITDEGYNVVGFDVPTINGFSGINAPPRQYGVTVRLNFGAGSFDWF